VQIHSIEVVAWAAPRLTIDVRCSKGTYIRTLAEDIGRTLGCGAHLAALRRTASGTLSLADAVTVEALGAMDDRARLALLQPPDLLLAGWPACRLPADEAARFLTGLRRRIDAADAPRVRVYGPDARALLGAAHITAGELIPDRLLSPAEVQALC
jgi:tRNA pseudouridine55 synthase